MTLVELIEAELTRMDPQTTAPKLRAERLAAKLRQAWATSPHCPLCHDLGRSDD